MKRENEHKEYCEQDILDQISRMSEDTEGRRFPMMQKKY